MRKLLFIALVLSVAMTGCKNKPADNQASANAESATEAGKSVQLTGKIAYINLDSLIARYNMAIDLRTAFEAKYKKADSELTAKGRRLEKDIADYQEKIQKGLVTRAQAAEIEDKLNKQQQTVLANRDKLTQELAEEEQVMNNRIYYGVVDYLNEYNSDYKYDMILSTTATGPIFSANPAMDITGEILVGLNAKYDAEKAAEQKK